ncbi:hypothetical protein L0128_02780 [candidate division KSB1 bacterium]|nr:hypothetical protein [candidate division KSB1 bacterium]
MNQFEVILLTARPAAGKSEVIHYLKNEPAASRLQRFHIGEFEEIDDFVYVWETFVNDDLLEQLGQPRLLTDKDYYFKGHFVWNFYIKKMNIAYLRKLAYTPDFFKKQTLIMEFARGGDHAIAEALSYFEPEILKRAGIFYLKVSYEESVRKNRARRRVGQEDSILYHSLPDEKMEFYYKTNDWEKLTAADPDFITVNGIQVPYAVLDNENDLTTSGGKPLGDALEQTFQHLWQLKQKQLSTRGK